MPTAILIPTHCSVLHYYIPSLPSSVLVLQAGRPSIIWNGLYPLLFHSPHRQKALTIILQFFSFHQTSKPPTAILPSGSFHETTINIPTSTTILLLPSEITSISPSPFTKLEKFYLKLQSLNAYISTLGGGYFLCRYLKTAITLSRYQRFIARTMGDESLVDKCTVNEAYNYIHAGQMKKALKMIRDVEKRAKKRGNLELRRICRAAKVFACRVEKVGFRESERVERTVDDFQRIRIVDGWKGIV